MQGKSPRALSLLAGAVLGLSLSGAVSAAEVGVTDTEITIGMFAPLSGPLAAYGVDPLNAAKLWYDQTNQKGGIHGRKIRVIAEDDKCSAQDVVGVVKKFVTVDKVFMIHGGSCTAPTVAAQEYVTREKIPLVMINAAGDGALFPPTRYVFGGFGGTQRALGASHVEFAAKQLKAKRIALVVHDDEFGASFRTTAEEAAKREGAQIVAVETISVRITDVTAPVLNIRAANPDAVISGAYPGPAVLLAQKAGEYGIKAALVQATQGIPVPETFAKNVGNDSALANFYYGTPLNDLPHGPKQKAWVDMYKAAYADRQNPSAFMAYGFPSAMAITRALESAGRDLTREKLVDALETVNFESGVMATPTAFGKDRRDGLRGSAFVKFDGKTHTLQPGVYHWNPPAGG